MATYGNAILNPGNPENIRLLQITDTHIYADPAGHFDGVDTRASLADVISHINQSNIIPDFVLATGDLVHDPVLRAYENLLQELLKLDYPVFCIPGNHDDPVLMQTVLNHENITTDKLLQGGNWSVMLLDCYLPGTHAGRLSDEELKYLEQQLDATASAYILLALHHPPVAVGSPWMDAMMLENPDDLFAITEKNDRIRGIVWGHIHQAFETLHNDMLLMGTPSTCVQFTPFTDRYTKDPLAAGYREINLMADGGIKTCIHRLPTS